MIGRVEAPVPLFSKEGIKNTFKYPLRAAVGLTIAGAVFAASTAFLNPKPAISAELNLPVIAIAHGVDARPKDGLVGKIIGILEQRGFEVIAPQLPLGEAQNIDAWKKAFSDSIAEAREKRRQVFLAGFSGGGQPGLHLIHENPAGYACGYLGISTVLEGRRTDLYRKFGKPKMIMENVNGNAGLWHAENDGVLPIEGAVALSQETGIPMLEPDLDGGHFIDLSDDQLEAKAQVGVTHIQTLAANCPTPKLLAA